MALYSISVNIYLEALQQRTWSIRTATQPIGSLRKRLARETSYLIGPQWI